MTQNTLYWHDYETFGIDPMRDRPVQFAGVRTDEDLNIIGEPLNILARPAADSLPHPISALNCNRVFSPNSYRIIPSARYIKYAQHPNRYMPPRKTTTPETVKSYLGFDTLILTP